MAKARTASGGDESAGPLPQLEEALRAVEEAAARLRGCPLEDARGLEDCCQAWEAALGCFSQLLSAAPEISPDEAAKLLARLQECDQLAGETALKVTLERERLRHALNGLELERHYLKSISCSVRSPGGRVDEQG